MTMSEAAKAGDIEKVKELLQRRGANPNTFDRSDGATPLTNACRNGHFEIVRLLLEKHADVNLFDKRRVWGNDKNQVPLMAACDSKAPSAVAIVKLLLEHGANVKKAHPRHRDGAMHFAAENGHLEAVSLFLDRGISANVKGDHGNTALIEAVSNKGSPALVKLLLEKGAEVNATKAQGSNALFELISKRNKGYAEIARILIDAGSDLHSKGLGGALYWASRCGRKEIVEMLLDKGLSPNDRDYDNDEIAVVAAMGRGHIEIVKLLLEHGADPNAKERFGDALLVKAAESGDRSLVQAIVSKSREKNPTALAAAAKKGNVEIVKQLIESGYDVNEKAGERGETALMLAAAFGRMDVAHYLLKKGADIGVRDNRGNTALLYAASTGKTEAVVLLLDRGASIHEKNDLNWNALMQACWEGGPDTVKVLLERGSPTDEIDWEKGATALSLAKIRGSASMVALLEARGAKDRTIRVRKPDEPYFSIFDCDICTYTPHSQELKKDFGPEDIPGLAEIHRSVKVDYKAEDTDIIRKCVYCGTYYWHSHFIDTEDPIGGVVYTCCHNMGRWNLEGIRKKLKEVGKGEELAELEKRLDSILASLVEACSNGRKIHPNLQPYVIECLHRDWKLLLKSMGLAAAKHLVAFKDAHPMLRKDKDEFVSKLVELKAEKDLLEAARKL